MRFGTKMWVVVPASLLVMAAQALVAATAGATTAAHARTQVTTQHLTYLGTFDAGSVRGVTAAPHPQIPPHMPNSKTIRHTAAAAVPSVASSGLSAQQLPGFGGFNGLSDADQVSAGTGIYAGTQFDLEPPDQGLCVSSTDVVETVNAALRVFDRSGNPLTPPIAFAQFYKLAPEEQPGPPPVFGSFPFDPRCYYDAATGHWFVTEGNIPLVPSTGAFGNQAFELIAVSETSDPTGTWRIYQLNVTDDGTNGTPTDTGCPCFGDQPLMGADANGFYLTTNEYTLATSAFNGGIVYAFSKTGLENNTNTTVTRIFAGPLTLSLPSGGLAFSIQPATSPTAADFQAADGGTEFFMSATDWGAAPALGTRADRVLVWALTNTSSLNTSSPQVSLAFTVVNSELYAQPPNATQQKGPTPLATAVHSPEELIAANDDRMNQVVYADGHLWAGLNTSVKLPTGATMVGDAWFIASPSDVQGTLSASMTNQGYLAVDGLNILYPAIGVTSAGTAVIAFSTTGPGLFPSTGYAPLSLSGGVGAIRMAGAGVLPDDGFSGYRAFGGFEVGRWGDYSAAVADSSGTIWFAGEYISGGPRTPFANWGTFVAHVTP